MKLNFLEPCLNHAKARRISEALEKESSDWRDSYQRLSQQVPPSPSSDGNLTLALCEWDDIAHGGRCLFFFAQRSKVS